MADSLAGGNTSPASVISPVELGVSGRISEKGAATGVASQQAPYSKSDGSLLLPNDPAPARSVRQGAEVPLGWVTSAAVEREIGEDAVRKAHVQMVGSSRGHVPVNLNA